MENKKLLLPPDHLTALLSGCVYGAVTGTIKGIDLSDEQINLLFVCC
jgi:hypothetical protein